MFTTNIPLKNVIVGAEVYISAKDLAKTMRMYKKIFNQYTAVPKKERETLYHFAQTLCTMFENINQEVQD